MNRDVMEVETKFYLDSVSGFLERLEGLGNRIEERFERNLIFDRENELRRKKGVLRLRIVKGVKVKDYDNLEFKVLDKRKVVLTAKEFFGKNEGIKRMKEYEVEVSDCDEIVNILRVLGYEQVRVYEKIRIKYKIEGVLVNVDILPFGRFVEIEGRKEGIEKVVKDLGLKKENMINESYLKLAEEQGHFEDVCF